MNDTPDTAGPVTLWAVFAAQRRLFGLVVAFGVFVNLLILTGPIFALQIYDRVLGSRSVETLVALTLLMAFLFLIMGILDHVRKRIAARIGERMITALEQPVFAAVLQNRKRAAHNDPAGFSDLEILRQFFGSAIFVALLDLPWLPIFLIGIAVFHPALGVLAAVGALLFLLPGLLGLVVRGTGRPGDLPEYHAAQGWAHLALSDPDMTHGLRLKNSGFDRWHDLRARARNQALLVTDRRAGMSSVAQTFRLFLQSAIIALGAYLVLQNQLTAGAIIATTVLFARALGPLDLISQNAVTIKSQLDAWRRLSALLAQARPEKPAPLSIKPGDGLQLDQVTVFPPNARCAALRMVGFDMMAGQAVGVIGPSGSGKTALAKTIAGIWPIAGGEVRIGGVPLDRISTENRFDHIGYLPQQLRLPDGSIAQNISGFATDPDADAIVQAARAAQAHDMILDLPAGYETRLGPVHSAPSGGLIQRIGLARAVFGQPALLVLDEPANNLDGDGVQALNEIVLSVTSAGGLAVVLSQRPVALAGCDHILVLNAGRRTDFGPAEAILQDTAQGAHPYVLAPRQQASP